METVTSEAIPEELRSGSSLWLGTIVEGQDGLDFVPENNRNTDNLRSVEVYRGVASFASRLSLKRLVGSDRIQTVMFDRVFDRKDVTFNGQPILFDSIEEAVSFAINDIGCSEGLESFLAWGYPIYEKVSETGKWSYPLARTVPRDDWYLQVIVKMRGDKFVVTYQGGDVIVTGTPGQYNVSTVIDGEPRPLLRRLADTTWFRYVRMYHDLY